MLLFSRLGSYRLPVSVADGDVGRGGCVVSSWRASTWLWELLAGLGPRQWFAGAGSHVANNSRHLRCRTGCGPWIMSRACMSKKSLRSKRVRDRSHFPAAPTRALREGSTFDPHHRRRQPWLPWNDPPELPSHYDPWIRRSPREFTCSAPAIDGAPVSLVAFSYQ